MAESLNSLKHQVKTALDVARHARRHYLDSSANYTRDRIVWGRGSYGSHGSPVIVRYDGPDSARVIIGSFVSIAMGVVMMEGGNHHTGWDSTYPLRFMLGLPGAHEDGHPFDKGDIRVGHDVWIGRKAHVMSGVTIGNGPVVAAYSVVTKDVRPYTIVGGNPAREIRRRFTDEQVEALLRIAWWDWSNEKIRENVPRLNGGQVDDFIARHEPRMVPDLAEQIDRV